MESSTFLSIPQTSQATPEDLVGYLMVTAEVGLSNAEFNVYALVLFSNDKFSNSLYISICCITVEQKSQYAKIRKYFR